MKLTVAEQKENSDRSNRDDSVSRHFRLPIAHQSEDAANHRGIKQAHRGARRKGQKGEHFKVKKIEGEYGWDEPLGVEALSQLSGNQATEFWLRELCIQIAAHREQMTEQLRLMREAIRFK